MYKKNNLATIRKQVDFDLLIDFDFEKSYVSGS